MYFVTSVTRTSSAPLARSTQRDLLKATTPVHKRAKAGLVQDLKLQVLRKQVKFYNAKNKNAEDKNIRCGPQFKLSKTINQCVEP